MSTISPPIVLFGGYFNQVPTLKSPFTIFGFDVCGDCESIFLNPDIPRQRLIDIYKNSTSYIKKMENKQEWDGYIERYEMVKKHFPANTESLIDAASGLGQIAFLARDDRKTNWKRVAALELSSAYVQHMNENGIEAYEFDIDTDPIEEKFESNTFDFIVFFEAFEHVAAPTRALEKLLTALKPGGRLYFSAQRYGPDVDLAIRPGEPIYISEKFIQTIEERLPCKLIDVERSGSRYLVVIEKLEVTDESLRAPLQRKIQLSGNIIKEDGHCWIVDLSARYPDASAELGKIEDNDSTPRSSHLKLFEVTGSTVKELDLSHSSHADIRTIGGGMYSHWKGALYFSTSDNSDPTTNGKSYYIQI